jgi:hypothetical protein
VGGVPPIYVYLSGKRRSGLPEDGHDYHQAPKTSEITGLSGLREVKAKTPKQGGSGKGQDGLIRKDEEYMNGILSMANSKNTELVTASISALLIIKLVKF